MHCRRGWLEPRMVGPGLLLVALLWVTAGDTAAAQQVRAWAGSGAETGPTTPARPTRLADASSGRSVAGSTVPIAAKPAIGGGSLLGLLAQGGILMVPLVGCSFVLVVFGIERALSLRTGRVVPRLFVERFVGRLEAGELDPAEALEACAENGSPVARVFAAAIRRRGRAALEIEQAVIDACEREFHGLRRYRRVFNAVATVAPLFGLLGTVLGLIRAFNDVATAGAMGQPDLLARGFGEALVTTAMGLLVAIPALVLHSFFTSRVEQLTMRLDAAGQTVIPPLMSGAVGETRRRMAG